MAGISIGAVMAGGAEGAGAAVSQIGQQELDTQQKMSLTQQAQQAELDRQKALEDYKVQAATTARTNMASSVANTSGLIQSQMQAGRLNTWGAKHQLSDGEQGPVLPTDNTPTNMTPDQIAQVPISDADKGKADYQAAKQLGYITPEQSATIDSKAAVLEAGNQRLGERLDSNERIAADRNATNQDRISAMFDARMAALDKASAGKGSTADRLTTIVNSSNATLTQLMNGSPGQTPDAKANYQRQVSDATQLRDMAMAGLKAHMAGADANGPSPSSPALKNTPTSAPSGNVRKDVSSAVADFLSQTGTN